MILGRDREIVRYKRDATIRRTDKVERALKRDNIGRTVAHSGAGSKEGEIIERKKNIEKRED